MTTFIIRYQNRDTGDIHETTVQYDSQLEAGELLAMLKSAHRTRIEYLSVTPLNAPGSLKG